MARVLVIREWAYPLDARLRQQVQALLADGHEVDVLCVHRPGERWYERDGRLRVLRVPAYFARSGPGYLVEYLWFTLLVAVVAPLLHLRRRYRLVQVCTLPDVLVFAAALPRMLGARILLDLRECMPEFFATKFGVGLDAPATRLIAFLEQASIRFADRAVTCTDQMKAAFVGRSADPSRIDVVLDSADTVTFDPARYPTRDDDGSFVIFSHGAVEARYGLDTAIRALCRVRADLPNVRLRLHGEGSALPHLKALAAELGVADRVDFSEHFVPLTEVAAAVAQADAGLVAMRRDMFRDLTQCKKMYDFIAMNKPVLVSRTRSVSAYFDDGSFGWFESGDDADLARAIREMAADPDLRRRMAARAAEMAAPYQWETQRRIYLGAVTALLDA